MTIVQAREAIWAGLKEHIGCPVVPNENNNPMPDPPYCYYSVLVPRITDHAFGLTELVETPEGFVRRRSEPVSATMSFTFCSINREIPGGYIYGEDEALELAEKAHGFFLLNGHLPSFNTFDSFVIRIALTVITFPLIYRFFRKFLRPALDYTASFSIWNQVWIIPICNNLIYNLLFSQNISSQDSVPDRFFYFIPPVWNTINFKKIISFLMRKTIIFCITFVQD